MRGTTQPMTRRAFCPKCRSVVSHAVQELIPERFLGMVHLMAGHYVREYAVAQWLGDCPRCGVVKGEVKVTR